MRSLDFLVVSLLIIILCFNSTEQTLKLILIIHRHGDRTPTSFTPADIYANDSYWPDGISHLTNNGRQRMYQVGLYIRKEYGDFLTFNPREVSIKSSDVDRCLESVGLIMSGAYPPKGRWIWNNNLNWFPFPIHTKPRKDDPLLFYNPNCPKADLEYSRLMKSYIVKLFQEYSNLLNFLCKKIGSKITKIDELSLIYENLKIAKEHGYQLPIWADDIIMEKLKEIYALSFYLPASTETLKKFRSGPLLEDISKNLIHASIIQNFPKKLFVYSSHDVIVANLLNTLQVYDGIPPPYGASLFIELHQNDNNNEFYIKLRYLNDTLNEKPIDLIIPWCGNNTIKCSLDKFLKYSQLFYISDWKKECSLDSADHSNFLMLVLIISCYLFSFFA